MTPSNVIILDEPTNHLDVFAKDILKQALVQYEGTLIIVSHDRKFLSGLTDRVIEFSRKKIGEYPGDIDSYLSQQKIVSEEPEKKKKGENNNQYKEKKERNKKIRSLTKQNNNIESEISNIENEICIFNKLLSEVNKGNSNQEVNYDDYNRLNDLLNSKLKKWEKIQDEIDDIKIICNDR